MSRDVLLTGFGVRTAFGAGSGALRDGVFDGRPAFAPITRFDTSPYRSAMAATGSGSASLREVLAETATAAMDMAGLPKDSPVAVLVGTAGDFTGLTRFWRATAAADGADCVGTVAETVPAWQAAALADELGVHGPRLAFTTACVASATAIVYACQLISTGRIDAVVCAGAYLVEEENLAKFGSGFALSHDGMVRPFCADRSGLLLGDGAAAIVLESADSARRRGASVLGALTGWGVSGDAHHVARPHPKAMGMVRASRQALSRAGDPRIDYVNAHGTATKTNDPAETLGLRELFGEDADLVPISSTKSTTGHMLEAAGVVELVITLLALQDGVVPPTAGFTERDPACDLDYVPNRPRQAEIRRALCVNAAFGGANTALVLERT